MRTLAVVFLALPLSAAAQTTDEPGIGGIPAPPAPPSSAPASAPTAMGFADVVEQLLTAEQGAGAAQQLAATGDPRAVLPLALAAVYGPTPNRHAVLDALRELVARPSTRPAATRMARRDADPVIRSVLTRALGGEAALRTSAPDATEQVEPRIAAPAELTDPDATRVVYGPTAFGRKKGVWNWTIYNIAYWNFDYGVTDYLEVGLQTAPPIGFVAFMPHLKLTTRLGEKAALGLRLFGGVIYPYIDNDDEWRGAIYGGGPVLSIGSPDLLLNLAVNVNGLTAGWENSVYHFAAPDTTETKHETIWAVTPTVGFGWRVARRVKLNAELYIPLTEDSPVGNGKLWILLYGVRIFGEHIYGDVSFVIPFWPDMSEIMKYIPIGFPLLTFGSQW